MYPLNDNDLDRLSRDAADQYDVESSTSGWEALETRLNKELPLKEEKERRRFLFWLFLIVLLAGAGLLWMMTGKNNPTIQMAHTEGTDGTAIPAQQDTKNTTPAASQPSPNVGIPQQDATKPAPTDGVPAPAAVTPSTGADAQGQQIEPALPAPDNNSKASAPRAKNSKPSAALPTVKDGGQQQSGVVRHDTYNPRPKANNTSGRKKSGRQDGESAVADNQNNQPIQNKLNNPKTYGQAPAQDDDLLKASLVSGVDMDVHRGTIIAPSLPIAADKPEAPEKKQQQKNKGFEIGLVAGPDMSNVKFTDMDKVGYNVGIQIGYRFSDRWSVNTGFLYTRKNYTAQGKDFTKPNNSWWQNRDLHGVQGYCAMFDIPLNIRYDFSVNKKQRWFASAGASSYIMTNEDYTYDYSYTGSSIIRQTYWESDSTSTYLFSILNLSAGFERALNKRFSVQAEPYFKFPLKGLGYGKLDLNSYGIYFSVKYKLGK